ncbi:MAG: DNA translocase FtsK [Chloroflexi bacterium]|nr:DNA translocase FtsK [Chloroflexota bacterium]
MAQDVSNANMTSMLLRAIFSSWYAKIAVLLVLAAAAGAVYWNRESISLTATSLEEGVISRLGLGVVAVALWLVVFAFALFVNQSLFRHYRLWLASPFLLAFLLGVLSFFAPFQGPLARFTLEGDITLGGTVGYAIAGEIVWLGVLRVAAVLAVAIAIASPGLAMGALSLIGTAFLGMYILAMSAGGAVGRMFKSRPKSDKPNIQSPSESHSQGRWSESLRETMELQEFRERTSPTSTWEPRSEHPEPDLDDPAEPPVVEELAESLERPRDAGLNGLPAYLAEPKHPERRSAFAPDPVPDSDDGNGTVSDEVADEPVQDVYEPEDSGRKFNRLWGGGAPDSDGGNAHLAGPESNGGNGRMMSMMQAVMGAASWKRPSLSMFVDASEGGITQEEMNETAHTIRETLGHYGVEVEVEDAQPGPTVTMYGLVPGWIRRQKQVNVTDADGKSKLDEKGRQMRTRVETKTRVKVDAITAREKDLSLALRTPSIRIETPVMGKSLVGVEVPNPNPALVTLRNVMQDRDFEKMRKKAKLPVAIGKGGSGETVNIDLAKMPHLLVAGSTGSGKSVFINTILSCLLIEKDPSELRVLLIDPKRVELTPYNGIPHLLTPVVVETDQVVSLLRGLIREMMDRYRRMEEIGVRNIDSYNKKSPNHMPYLVVAVDELADLMMTASVDVEQALCRLAQLGRATGIHLVVATQRPSVDVLTGLIKANFPSRVSFALTSQVDSRTILDTAGAEKLLGKGDMLYQSVDMSRPERVQGVFISDSEIEDLVSFWQSTPRGPMADISLEPVGGAEADETDDDDEDVEGRDDMMDKAIELATRQKKLSTSLLQRRLRIGYPRAARLMDQLEEEGIVGPSDGSKSRDVIIGV